ncbi:MAG: AAA family ATPase [Pseudomonadota bacterium]|nr:AAA family ATPase [Pseudomonadota bacterium]
MFLKKVEIEKYKHFEKTNFPLVFTIASKNGGGKTTMLQFIFTILHCFTKESKKVYIKNVLGNLTDIESEKKLAKFIIEDNNENYTLEFLIAPAESPERNFNLFLDLEETDKKVQKHKRINKKSRAILELKKEVDDSERITPLLEKDLRDIAEEFIKNPTDRRLYREARISNDIEAYKKLLNSIIDSNYFSPDSANELESIYYSIQEKIKNLKSFLKEDNLSYITHLLNVKTVLLLKSNMPEDLLEKLSNKIFLTTPSSQIFLFLSEEQKANIFYDLSKEKNSFRSYDDNVQSAKKALNGFFTYDFASTDLILESFEKAFQKDRVKKLKTGEYGAYYDELVEEFRNFLEGKEILVDENFEKVIFKQNSIELSPEDLSHGELKKLSIYIWLKHFVEPESIILMDEVDIALHPTWQYKIINDLTSWSQNSQFLLATHSPQILSSTYYKNLIKLTVDNSKVEAERYSQPPVDRDINAIITTIMESPDFPEELLELHKKYRKLIRDGKIDTEEAKKLKNQILEYESENSAFFQDIHFDLELL